MSLIDCHKHGKVHSAFSLYICVCVYIYIYVCVCVCTYVCVCVCIYISLKKHYLKIGIEIHSHKYAL